jgi:hypothetical protein
MRAPSPRAISSAIRAAALVVTVVGLSLVSIELPGFFRVSIWTFDSAAASGVLVGTVWAVALCMIAALAQVSITTGRPPDLRALEAYFAADMRAIHPFLATESREAQKAREMTNISQRRTEEE